MSERERERERERELRNGELEVKEVETKAGTPLGGQALVMDLGAERMRTRITCDPSL